MRMLTARRISMAAFFCSRASLRFFKASFSSPVSSCFCFSLRSASSACLTLRSSMPRLFTSISFTFFDVEEPTIPLRSLNLARSTSSSLSSSSLYSLGSSKPLRLTRSMMAFLSCSSIASTLYGFIIPPSAARIGQKFKNFSIASFCSDELILPDLWLSSIASAISLRVRSGAKSNTYPCVFSLPSIRAGVWQRKAVCKYVVAELVSDIIKTAVHSLTEAPVVRRWPVRVMV